MPVVVKPFPCHTFLVNMKQGGLSGDPEALCPVRLPSVLMDLRRGGRDGLLCCFPCPFSLWLTAGTTRQGFPVSRPREEKCSSRMCSKFRVTILRNLE